MIKPVIIISTIIVSMAGVGLGFWVWHGHHKQAAKQVTTQSSANSGPLGLHVREAGGSAADTTIGQISPQTGQTTNPSTNKAAAPDPFDPSTFTQYDKYKDGQSGLFADAQKGTGDELTADKTAGIFYKGWLTDGKLFDASRSNEKGELQPFVFTLGQHKVVPGLEQGVEGMKVGGVRLVIIPPAVGYGPEGKDPIIPANAVLVFEVQLVAVK